MGDGSFGPPLLRLAGRRGKIVQEEDSDLASLPVRVVFQAGQIEMTISDVERLAPGVLVPIDRTIDDVLDIVVNGKRIGRGGLVSVGNGLAVRVTRLNTDA